MRLTLLGTGSAAGMPLYGCNCSYCIDSRHDKKLCRGPSHALLEYANKCFLIDAGLMDITEKFPAGKLNGIFITHFHPDHVQGLFHIRWGINTNIPVYCPIDETGCADLYKHPGILSFQPQKILEPFKLDKLKITPLPLNHSKPTIGYLFEDEAYRFAYLSDTKGVPSETKKILNTPKPLNLAIIDTSYAPGIDNKNHNNLDDTIEIHNELNISKTVLTHIGHDFDIWLKQNNSTLPKNIIAGHDGYIAISH